MWPSLLRMLLLFSWYQFTIASCSCNKGDCFKDMKSHPSLASAFCTPYLATTYIATSGIPSLLSNCKASSSDLSSACSCILTSTTRMTTSTYSGTTSSDLSNSSSHSSTQTSCSATITITAFASTVTTTVTTTTSPSGCPSIGTTNTVISVSTTTTTVTATTFPTCIPYIVGGDFTSSSQDLAAFTVVEAPPETIFNEVIATSEQEVISVSDGTPQFLYNPNPFIQLPILLNFVILPDPSTFTLQQFLGTICAPYSLLTLSATINAQSSDGTISFCISPSTCSNPQIVSASNGKFVQYSASFPILAGASITASLNLAVNDFVPVYVAGIGNFGVSAS